MRNNPSRLCCTGILLFAMFLALPLQTPLLAAPGKLSAAGKSVTIAWNTLTGSYSVSAQDPAWAFAGTVGGPINNARVSRGTDKIGLYQQVTFDWSFKSVPLTGTIRAYQTKSVVLFQVHNGAPELTPAPSFPDFTSMPNGLHAFSYHDGPFAPPSFTALQNGTPLLLFNNSDDAAIMSTASHFMVQRIIGDGKARMAAGLNSEVPLVPAGTTLSSLLVIGHGINAVWNMWGDALTNFEGKVRPANDSTVGLKYLGYWTDHGAYYWYNYDPKLGYAGTLLAAAKRLREDHVPVHYLQLDSWWYEKSLKNPAGVVGGPMRPSLPHGLWNRFGGTILYKADPTLFPNGLAAFQRHLGLPLIIHNRWTDPTSPYYQKDHISGIAAVDPAFWKGIATYLQSSGVVTYEQDWLSSIYRRSPALGRTFWAGDAFFGNMASAMQQHGLTMQYCMATPREMMEGSQFPNLTTVRVSQDRFNRDKWDNFLYTSRLAESLGLWPWSDVYNSTETDNLLLSDLSAGMVGFGDQMGHEDRASLLHAVRADGVIVKPDIPIVPTDASYIAAANAQASPLTASTETTGNGQTTLYVFAYTDPKAVDQSVNFIPRHLGVTGPAYVYDYFAQKATLVPRAESFHGTLGGDATAYYVVAPVGASGIAFLGDPDDFVSMGRQRIASVKDQARRLVADVLLGGSESAVRLHGYAAHKPKVTAVGGVVSGLTYDRLSKHFMLTVTRDKPSVSGKTASVKVVLSEQNGPIR